VTRYSIASCKASVLELLSEINRTRVQEPVYNTGINYNIEGLQTMNKTDRIVLFILAWVAYFLTEIVTKGIYTTMASQEIVPFWLTLWSVSALMAVAYSITSGVLLRLDARLHGHRSR
jgi:hypothetical protein